MKREEAIAILQDKHDECKAFYDLAAHPEDAYPGTKEYMEALQMALAALRGPMREQVEIIDRQPTIDPESLRSKGHWERPSKLLNIVNCTACKTAFPGDFDEFRYCPYCGCFMENKRGIIND